MITKKITTQKGFRLPEEMINDLSTIATITGRSQNELVEIALNDFIRENIAYIIEGEITTLLVSYNFEICFTKTFGDILVYFDINYPNDDFEMGQKYMEMYRLNENILSQLNYDYSVSEERDEGVLQDRLFAKKEFNENTEIVEFIHEVLSTYNYKTPLMQEWIHKRFTY